MHQDWHDLGTENLLKKKWMNFAFNMKLKLLLEKWLCMDC